MQFIPVAPKLTSISFASLMYQGRAGRVIYGQPLYSIHTGYHLIDKRLSRPGFPPAGVPNRSRREIHFRCHRGPPSYVKWFMRSVLMGRTVRAAQSAARSLWLRWGRMRWDRDRTATPVSRVSWLSLPPFELYIGVLPRIWRSSQGPPHKYAPSSIVHLLHDEQWCF